MRKLMILPLLFMLVGCGKGDTLSKYENVLYTIDDNSGQLVVDYYTYEIDDHYQSVITGHLNWVCPHDRTLLCYKKVAIVDKVTNVFYVRTSGSNGNEYYTLLVFSNNL